MSGFTQTPNLGLYKPNYNSDTNQWGYHLNANADVLDTVLGGAAAGPFLPTSGGTISGNLTIQGSLTINGNLILPNLPKSTSGLAVGTLWNNGGFLCVV